jgi:hypothetical protein
MMVATGVAMLRRRDDAGAGDGTPVVMPLWRIVADGLVVGAITGLVGAGGGFLVVPALTLLGGLSMKRAVGTSLLVIAMKSFAGFAGYAGHVTIDVELGLIVAGAASAGALAGAWLASRVPQHLLRRGFAWFVLIGAVVFIALQLPAEVRDGAVYRAVFVDRWPWWAGGLGVAAVVLGLLWADGKLLGVTTGLSETCALPRGDGTALRSWRPGLLIGIVLGAAAAALFAGSPPQTTVPLLAGLVGAGWIPQALWLGAGGVLLGWGARRAGGCTSGHGIVGTAQLAPASLLATGLFLAGGFATTWVLIAAGGAP